MNTQIVDIEPWNISFNLRNFYILSINPAWALASVHIEVPTESGIHCYDYIAKKYIYNYLMPV